MGREEKGQLPNFGDGQIRSVAIKDRLPLLYH